MLSIIWMISQLRRYIQNSDTPLVPSKLISMCVDCEASLPSDKIYALYGLFLKDSQLTALFPIKYHHTVARMYQKFTLWCIAHENNLDIIVQKRNEGSTLQGAVKNLPS